MKSLPLCIVLLAFGCAPAWAAQPAQATQTTPQTPADRAALMHRLTTLQQRMGKLTRQIGALSSQLNLDTPDAVVYQYQTDSKRGMLGVALSPAPANKGAKVIALTPNGPAQQAGVHVGDIITRVDGKPVNGKQTTPWPLGYIKAGETVNVALLRDGKTRHASVKAVRKVVLNWTDFMAPGALDRPNVLPRVIAAFESQSGHRRSNPARAASIARAMQTARGALQTYVISGGSAALSPWWGLNLAPLNAGLGAYFGTQSGALVLSSQPKRYPALKAGDVITAVNGKAVANPEEVMRALRGQLSGMTMHLAVRRHGKSVDVKMKVPAASQTLPPALRTSTGKLP